MPFKVLLATVVATVFSTAAFAYCDEARMKPDGSMCPHDMIYDHEFALCVEKPTA
ncbi:MAG: hypothetical protein AAGP08_14540 [Pseudomonadota bacterium]